MDIKKKSIWFSRLFGSTPINLFNACVGRVIKIQLIALYWMLWFNIFRKWISISGCKEKLSAEHRNYHNCLTIILFLTPSRNSAGYYLNIETYHTFHTFIHSLHFVHFVHFTGFIHFIPFIYFIQYR